MRLPRAAVAAASPAISAAGFSLLQDSDILEPLTEIFRFGENAAAGDGGGWLFSSLPMVGISRNQEINAASSEVRFGRENGDTTDEAVVVGGGSGEDVAGIGVEDLGGGERR